MTAENESSESAKMYLDRQIDRVRTHTGKAPSRSAREGRVDRLATEAAAASDGVRAAPGRRRSAPEAVRASAAPSSKLPHVPRDLYNDLHRFTNSYTK